MCNVTHLWFLWRPSPPHLDHRRHLVWTVRRCIGSWTPESPSFGYPRDPSKMDQQSSSPFSSAQRRIFGILSGTLYCKIGPKYKLKVSQWTWRNRLSGTSPSLQGFFWGVMKRRGGEGCWDFVVVTSLFFFSSKIRRSPSSVINIESEIPIQCTCTKKSIKSGQSPYKLGLISLLLMISRLSVRRLYSDWS